MQDASKKQEIDNKFNDIMVKVLLIKRGLLFRSRRRRKKRPQLGHQMRSKNYLLSRYTGTLSKTRIINKISWNYNFNQLRVKILTA